MPDVSLFSAWESFYVIVGSSAGALTGLMFVVITLISDKGGSSASAGVAAYGTPNVVHFCTALLISAILSAPWHQLAPAAVLIGLTGVGGTIYAMIVTRRARTQTVYQPVLEDWIFHSILPLVAYALMMIAAVLLPFRTDPSLFAIAASTVLLLVIGLHNAWDTVTYLALDQAKPRDGKTE